MRMQIFVRLREGVLDVQGKAVEHGLEHLGLNASEVRVGKLIELDVDASSKDEAEDKLKQMCEKLLVNTVIESYEIKENA